MFEVLALEESKRVHTGTKRDEKETATIRLTVFIRVAPVIWLCWLKLKSIVHATGLSPPLQEWKCYAVQQRHKQGCFWGEFVGCIWYIFLLCTWFSMELEAVREQPYTSIANGATSRDQRKWKLVLMKEVINFHSASCSQRHYHFYLACSDTLDSLYVCPLE